MTAAPTAYTRTIVDLGGPALAPEDVVAAWHLGPTPVVLAHFLRRAVSPADLDRFRRHFDAAVATVAPFPGVVDLLETLRRNGFPLGVYTTATRRAANLMLGNARLDRLFPAVVGGDEVDRPKPDPLGLLLACERLNVDPENAVYVGDAEVDLRCARAAGALGIHAAWGTPAARTGDPVAYHPADVLRLVTD